MSFIHEALKRSDRARRLLGASRLEPPDSALAPPPRAPRWLPWFVLLLIANLGLLAWWLWWTPAAEVSPPARYAGEVRSLEREVGSGDPVTPQALAAEPRASAPAAGDGATDAPPGLDALPAGLRAGLPPLHIDALAWSEDPAQRFAIIDLKRREVGDALGGGATLVAIRADGVVVEVGGQRVTIAAR